MEDTTKTGLEKTYRELTKPADEELSWKIDEATAQLMEDFNGYLEQILVSRTVHNNIIDAEARFHRSMANLKWLIWEKNRRFAGKNNLTK